MKILDTYSVGIYCRLSRDDQNGQLESMSIENQRRLLRDFVMEKGWDIYDIYIDDGYSGSNFNRPAFQKMLDDVDTKKINCIVTKDLSRIGRNYVSTGYYTESYFPEHAVRFIALNDSVDTAQEYNQMAAFQNIINEILPRETSKKVRQVKRKNAMAGKFIGSQPSYGYLKSPADKHQLIIDEAVAPIVRRIFTQLIAGDSSRFIAEKFNGEGLPSPLNYRYIRQGKEIPENVKRIHWGSTAIIQIVQNQTYLGHLVQCVRQNISFKSTQREFTDPEDWVIVKNTHEPIVDQETWEAAQKCVSEHRVIRHCADQKVSTFASLLICADCGRRLASSNKQRVKTDGKRIYKCSTYNNNGKTVCSAHYTDEKTLCAAILQEFHSHIDLFCTDEIQYLSYIKSTIQTGHATDMSSLQEVLARNKCRMEQIESVIKKMCEQNYEGNIPESVLTNSLYLYTKEYNELKQQTRNLESDLAKLEAQKVDLDSWIQVMTAHRHIDMLDREAALQIIDHVVIHEVSSEQNAASHSYEIHFNYIGNLKLTEC